MSSSCRIGIVRLEHAADLPLPAYETSLSAGMDLRAAIDEAIELAPGERVLVPTGLVLEFPPGTEGQVRPRSGLALKHGISCVNSPGTIDADYRGEVGVILINHGQQSFTIERGMRIAQLVVAPVLSAILEPRHTVAPSPRGGGGFGSTGEN